MEDVGEQGIHAFHRIAQIGSNAILQDDDREAQKEPPHQEPGDAPEAMPQERGDALDATPQELDDNPAPAEQALDEVPCPGGQELDGFPCPGGQELDEVPCPAVAVVAQAVVYPVKPGD